MKPTLLFTTLAMVFAAPTLLAKSELETLRSLCKEQERQIQLLEDENAQLRSIEVDSRSKSPKSQPISTAIGKTVAEKSPAATDTATYTVKAGDSFGRIARKVGTSPEELAKSNGLKLSAVILPGQKLKVPGATSGTQPVAKSSSPEAKNHKVVPGETFYSISRKHGMSTEVLMSANPTIKPSALRPGQVVSLVVGDTSATTMISNSTKSSTVRNTPAPANKTPAAVPKNIPVSTPAAAPAAAASAAPVEETAPAPAAEGKIHPVTIDTEMTYGDFAANHGTDTERLNALNGLDLTNATVLARGSELYVPAQP